MPHLLELRHFAGRRTFRQRLEGANHAIAARKEDQRLSIHLGKRRRRPCGVKDIRADVLIIARHISARLFLQHDEARRVRGLNRAVRIIHARAGVDVKVIAVDQDRTVRAIVRPCARAGRHVEEPHDIRIRRTRRGNDGSLRERLLHECRRQGDVRQHVLALAEERAVVSIRHPLHIQAHHFSAIIHRVSALAFHRHRRRHARLRPVEILILQPLWNHELPEHVPVLFIQAQHHPAIPLLLGIPRHLVICSDENAPTCDDRRAMRLGAERDNPLDVLPRGDDRTTPATLARAKPDSASRLDPTAADPPRRRRK